jgi:hypothetical protein
MRDVYTLFGSLLQQHFAGSQSGGGISNAARSSCMSSGGLSSSVAAVPTGPAEGGNSSSAGSDANSSGGTAWAAAKALTAQHITAATPEEALKQAEALWPPWSRACCRLLPEPQAGNATKAPTAAAAAAAEAATPAAAPAAAQPWPEEAAAVLQQVARLALALPAQKRRQLLARNRVVQGLVQSLRVLPPPPGQHAPAPAGEAPPQPVARGAEPAAGGSSSGASSGSLAGSAAAVRAALWALAVLGGAPYWQADADALCTLLPTCRFTKLPHVSSHRCCSCCCLRRCCCFGT